MAKTPQFDLVGWLKTVKETNSARDLYILFDDVSSRYERRDILVEEYETMRDRIYGRFAEIRR